MHTTTLDKIFAATVERGWRPNTPAGSSELVRLEASHVRGDCTSPLLQDGDTVFIDRRIRAQPGDLAAFCLSARGCEAQNSKLPHGQTPWAPGAPWIKHDRPVLHPVRNVMRGGRLLYTPDSYAAELGLASATVMLSTTITSVTISASGTNLASITVGPYPDASKIVATLSGQVTGTNSSGTLNAAAWGNLFVNLTATDFSTSPTAFSGGYVNTSSSEAFTVSLERLLTLAAGATQTFYLNAINVGPASMTEVMNSGIFKIEVIRR
jgi:hypothetical protein